MSNLIVNELTKSYNLTKVLDSLSFSITPGEIVGIVGPNGAGKTTLMKILTGLVYPDKGTFSVCGIQSNTNNIALKKEIGSVIEEPKPYLYLTGYQNVQLVGRMRNTPNEQLEELCNLVGLSDRMYDKVSRYSLGMKQRLGIAMALVGNPKLLLLDEPLNGIDPLTVIEFRQLLKSIVSKTSCAILISSHMLSELSKLCNRFLFINKGRIVSVSENHFAENSGVNSLEIFSLYPDQAIEILKRHLNVKHFSIKGNQLIVHVDNFEESKLIEIVQQSKEILGFRELSSSIEKEYSMTIGGPQ